MSVESQIAKLEALLGRIRLNVGKLRAPQEVAGPVVDSAQAADALPVTLAENEVPQVDATASAEVEALNPSATGGEISAGDLEELDMMDDEIVELGATASVEDLDADLTEQVPESAPRAALGAEPMPDELDLEPPAKTPPPESGRQVVSPVVSAPSMQLSTPEPEELDLAGAGDVESLLEADLTDGPISKARPGVPTMEQLGETVELEGADAPAAFLELEQPAPVSPRVSPEPDPLELPLPGKEFSGAYDADLAPPSGARVDLEKHRLEQHRRDQESRDAVRAARAPAVTFSAPPSGPDSVPPVPASAAAETVPAVSRPLVIERPAAPAMAHVHVHVADVIAVKLPRPPETFLELLDQSLAL